VAGTVVFAFDKFRGSATNQQLRSAAKAAAEKAGWQVIAVPLADGGEGSLDVLGGANKVTTVPGPLGEPVEAGWRLAGQDAYIEMAAASGLLLIGGSENNDPMLADTAGTGKLIATAVELGARSISVMLGGSATTDGGLGAIGAMPTAARMKEIDLVIGCDVETRFADAAVVFGPQKGASPAQVKLLTRRLEQLQQQYLGSTCPSCRAQVRPAGLPAVLLPWVADSNRGLRCWPSGLGSTNTLRQPTLSLPGKGFWTTGLSAEKLSAGFTVGHWPPTCRWRPSSARPTRTQRSHRHWPCGP
jgi:glycerate kinase